MKNLLAKMDENQTMMAKPAERLIILLKSLLVLIYLNLT